MEFSTRIPMLFLSLNVEFAYLKKQLIQMTSANIIFLWTDGNCYVNEKKKLRLCVKVKKLFLPIKSFVLGSRLDKNAENKLN